jgi:hypothetical protein
MSISVGEIVVGSCFATATNRVRRVVKVENGKVTYEERSKTESGGLSQSRTTIGDEKFARQAVRKVPCE